MLSFFKLPMLSLSILSLILAEFTLLLPFSLHSTPFPLANSMLSPPVSCPNPTPQLLHFFSVCLLCEAWTTPSHSINPQSIRISSFLF